MGQAKGHPKAASGLHKAAMSMSQRAVETVLGRLITDAEFRDQFFAAPSEVCRQHEIGLTPRETSALLQLSVQALHGLMSSLDPKIVRAAIVSPVRNLGREKSTEMRADRDESRPVTGLRRG
jgi:hypothetical protein